MVVGLAVVAGIVTKRIGGLSISVVKILGSVEVVAAAVVVVVESWPITKIKRKLLFKLYMNVFFFQKNLPCEFENKATIKALERYFYTLDTFTKKIIFKS